VPGVDRFLETKFFEIQTHIPDIEYIKIGIDKDHVHLHIVIPPRYSVSKIVGIMKQNTSKWMKEKFGFLKKVYWDNGGVWGKGFFVSTVGINEDILRKYVEMQGLQDTGQSEIEL
jgi:putative transposase